MSLVYGFTDAQISELEASRAVFNNFTGSRLSLQQYIHFVINDAISAETRAAKNASAIAGKRPSTSKYLAVGASNVH